MGFGKHQDYRLRVPGPAMMPSNAVSRISAGNREKKLHSSRDLLRSEMSGFRFPSYS